MISKLFSLFGIFKPLIYIYIFMTSVLQFIAISDFLVDEWGWHWLIAAPTSFILAGIPWISAILGVICSYFAWDFELWQSILLLAGPNLVLAILLIILETGKLFNYDKLSKRDTQQHDDKTIADSNLIWVQIQRDGMDIINKANALYESYCKNEPLLAKLTDTAAQDYFGSDIAIPKAIVNVTCSLIDTCNAFEQLQPEIEKILYKIENTSTTHKTPEYIRAINKNLKNLIKACSVMPTRKGELKQILDAAHRHIELLDLCTLKVDVVNSDKNNN